MSDITLSSGKEITFDLTRMTVREYRALFDKSQGQDEEDTTLARVCGLTVEEYLDIPYPEWKQLTVAFFHAVRMPLANPN